MKDSIVCISSANGLGHSKRLLRILNSFDSSSWNKYLVCSRVQRKFIHSDLEFSSDIIFVEQESCGLDGPSVKRASSAVPHSLEALISNSRLVISDNVLWPFKYSERSILLSNFIWLDYWNRKLNFDLRLEEGGADSFLKKQMENDYFILKNYKVNAIQYVPFGWLDSIKPISFIGLPSNIESKKSFNRSKEIWISSGTTGLDVLTLPQESPNGFNFKKIETYNFGKSSELPLAVIGRPGIGSITDTLIFNVPFIPFFSSPDPELRHNVKILRDLSLLSPSFDVDLFLTDFHRILSDELVYAESQRLSFAKDFKTRFLVSSVDFSKFLVSTIDSL